MFEKSSFPERSRHLRVPRSYDPSPRPRPSANDSVMGESKERVVYTIRVCQKKKGDGTAFVCCTGGIIAENILGRTGPRRTGVCFNCVRAVYRGDADRILRRRQQHVPRTVVVMVVVHWRQRCFAFCSPQQRGTVASS